MPRERSAVRQGRRRLASLKPAAEALEARDLPTTFVVANVDDAGPGSLRQAILDANATTGADRVEFAIPGAGVHTIRPATPLPVIEGPLAIDGYTQPGSRPNALADGFDAVLQVELDGGAIGSASSGLSIRGRESSIRGLIIGGFTNGITVRAGFGDFFSYFSNPRPPGSRIEGNIIGLAPAGASSSGNTRGIVLDGTYSNTIGGTTAAARNLISGNSSDGILLRGHLSSIKGSILAIGSRANVIAGNIIGAGATGVSGPGNGGDGIAIRTDGGENIIGGMEPGAGNIIAFNGGGGVVITGATSEGADSFTNSSRFTSSTGDAILSNAIFANSGLGIDLGDDGPTGNDPRDVDSGSNLRQNYPAITNFLTLPGASSIGGVLLSKPQTTCTIQFFSQPAGNPAGRQVFLGSTSATTDATGRAVFDFSLAGFPSGATITATATDPDGNTSEFSPDTTEVADLAVTSTVSRSTVGPAGALVYTVTVTNNGPARATRARVAGTIVASGPIGDLRLYEPLTVANLSGSSGRRSVTSELVLIETFSRFGGPSARRRFNLVAELADLEVGETATLVVNLALNTVFPGPPPFLVDTVPGAYGVAVDADFLASSEQNDLALENGAARLSVPVILTADLAVDQSTSPGPAAVGRDLAYTIGVTNRGPFLASGVRLSDLLPEGVAFVSSSLGTFDPVTRTLSAALGSLDVGSRTTVTFVVRPLVAGVRLFNTVNVAADQDDPDPTNNGTQVLATDVASAVDLAVDVSSTPGRVVAGRDLTYTIGVTNRGPSTATGVRLVDLLPAGVAFVSTSLGTSDLATGTLTALIGDLAVGSRVTITLVVRPLVSGVTAFNTANVTADQDDPDPTNNLTRVTATGVVSPTPPVVVSLRRLDVRGRRTRLILTFSVPLDPDRADNTDAYVLVAAGPDGRLGTRDDRMVKVASATYNPATRSVALTSARRIGPNKRVRVTALGRGLPGLADAEGNLLDGDRDGLAGGDYVGRAGRVPPRFIRRSSVAPAGRLPGP